MRTTLTRATALFVLSLGLPRFANAADPSRQVCGVVVEISCDADAPHVLTLMPTPGQIVVIDASSMALATSPLCAKTSSACLI